MSVVIVGGVGLAADTRRGTYNRSDSYGNQQSSHHRSSGEYNNHSNQRNYERHNQPSSHDRQY